MLSRSSPQKIAEVRWQLCSKGPSWDNFLATGGFFGHNTYRITALSWLNNPEFFDRFRLFILERVLDTITVTVETGTAYISSSKCLWTLAFAARQNYCRVNANTLIGVAILFPGHPYVWATLPRAHNTRYNFITLESLKSGGYVMLVASVNASNNSLK